MGRGAGRTATMGDPDDDGKPPRTRRPAAEHRIGTGNKRLEWVVVSQMRISPRAQRKHDGPGSVARIEHIRDNFDPDKFGTLTVSFRDGTYWVLDGGHRYLGLVGLGYDDGVQQVQCWVYRGLAEADEAELFLSLNDVKSVSGMEKFKQALVAGRPIETDIDRIVRAADLTIGSGRDAIGCVGAVRKTYTTGGARGLSTTVRVIRDAYGIHGFSSKVTEGAGMFVAQYENTFEETILVDHLSKKQGGVNGLICEAERFRTKYGLSLGHGIAAAMVETYNRGLRSNQKLNGWWSTFNGDDK